MNNKDFWDSVNVIIVVGFTPEGLQKLDEYAEQFVTGRLVYQRFSPAEQQEQKLMQIELLHKMSADSKGNPLVRETAPQACGQKKSNTIIPLTIHRERDRREICKPTD